MKLEKAKRILEAWVEADRKYRNNKTETDFDRFCEERNIAIETVLETLKIW